MLRLTTMICLFVCAVCLPGLVPATSAQETEGQTEKITTWFGTLDVGAIQLRLQLDVNQGDDGTLTGVMTSIDQGNAKIKMDKVAMEDGKLTFACAAIQCSYEGKTKEAGVIEGTFKQFGQKLPLTLKLVTDPESLQPNRPQHPREPYPYKSDEVTFDNQDADVTLAGTLTMPNTDAPFPAVILVTGSGPQDRDESLMGHKPFLVLADHLTRKGIAVLRYDDRGTGKSTGSFGESTSKDFASDAAAGIAYLANHEKLDAKRIGLVGHSEGGLIGGMLAANNDQLAHVVLLAGPGVSGDEIIRTQTAALSEAAGMEADSADLQMVTEVLDALKSDASADEIATIAEKYLDDDDDDDEHDESGEDSAEVDSERDSADATSSESAANIAKRIAMRQFASPWFRYFVKYDPQADLAKVKCPVLAMNGAKDLQVLVDVNLPAIEKALQSAPAQGHQIERLEGLNHLFQTAETGLPAEYGKIEETMSPRALKLISDWILAH